jgi:small subunit ribosomal protein S1
VELEEGIEGLIHVSELTKEKGGNPLSRFKVDDVIQAKVINVNKTDKKIGLSVRKLEESDDKEIYNNYLNSRMEATSNLGELLREMQSQQENVEEDETAQEQEEAPLADFMEEEKVEAVQEASANLDEDAPADTQEEPMASKEEEPESNTQ